jgi:drug/metabolite transporter (DMT)-like permease
VFVVGMLSAVAASAMFNLGLALQGLAARRMPRLLGLRFSLLTTLLRRPRWLLGLLLGFLGIGPQVLALAEAPFVVVQSALVSGLLLLLWIGARHFHERVGSGEVAGVLAIIGGVALVAWGAPPHVEQHRGPLAVAGVTGALAVLALLPFPLRGTRWDFAVAVMLAAGCGFAASNVATKLMSDAVGGDHFAGAGIWAAAGLATGVAATIAEMTAFQRARATMVVTLVTSVQIFLPIVLEPLFLRERLGAVDLAGAPIAVGILVALAGTVLVSRTRAVSELAAGM